MSLLTDAEKASLVADFELAVDTWVRPLIVYQEAQKTVIVSDPNWNPIEAWGQNNTDIANTPVFSTINGRILWDKAQEWKYMKPYAGQGTNDAQIKVKDQTQRACRLKVDQAGYELLKTAKKVEIDGVLMDPESLPRPHGLFSPNYWTFYFVGPSKYMAEVFMRKIVQTIADSPSADRVMRAAAEKVAQKRFDKAVDELKEQFASHPVTLELKGGVDAPNDSETLLGRGATENLYSFIGFKEGVDPTIPIEKRLDPKHQDGPKLSYVGKDIQRNSIRYQFKAASPDEKAIWEETKMPWASGLSWAQKIEGKIQGFGKFLAKVGKGRSGGGIQTKNELRSADYQPPSGGYLQTMFKRFLERIRTMK